MTQSDAQPLWKRLWDLGKAAFREGMGEINFMTTSPSSSPQKDCSNRESASIAGRLSDRTDPTR